MGRSSEQNGGDILSQDHRMRLRLFLFAIAAAAPAVAAEPDYLRQVKPLLAGRCYACHGALKQEAGLRLDTAELMRKGGDSGPVAQPGKSAESSLIERVTHADPDTRMPPEGEGAPLSA
jgi:mono/diheme cytochrome c family protein